MRNAFNKIALTFTLIALLPISFVLYELTSWNDNEQLIRDIYRNQLEALLFSVNQYSDDIVNSWANRVSNSISETKSTNDLQELELLSEQRAIEQLYLYNPAHGSRLFSPDSFPSLRVQKWLDEYVVKNTGKVEKLIRYQEAGFRKLEAIDSFPLPDRVAVSFVINTKESNPNFAVLIVNLPDFISQVLGPKMQAIAQDKFIISAFKARNDSLVYASAIHPISEESLLRNMTEAKREWQQKPFWLLPGYYLGISTKGATIDDFVKERQSTSLFVLLFLVSVLILGIVFLYKNIKREMQLSQAKSEFVSNVSHEIRTPLSLISMYAETLEMGRVHEEKKKEYYSIISKETARLSRIVNRILNFSQAESNKKKYRHEPVSLNDLVTQTVESFTEPMREKGFSFELKRDENVEEISGDRESITEAVVNLIDNAIKYSGHKKYIEVKTGRERNYSFIEVTDQGIGIAKRHHRDIFDQFFRAPTGDVHNVKGSGLGLALVKKTMDAHHGKIIVQSEPGKGSTFRLCFPLNHKNNGKA